MRIHILVLGCLTLMMQDDLAAQTAPTAGTSEPAWLTPKLVKAPEYPVAMIERKQASEVDAILRITKEGKLKEIVSIRSTPKAEEAEAAVRDILDQWTFRPKLASDCRPIEAEGAVRVWFDLDGTRPAVSVARPKGIPWIPTAPATIVNRDEFLAELENSYPRNARESSIGAQVVVAIEVNGDTGMPVKAQSTFVELDWDMGDSPVSRYYGESAEKAAMAARYAPLAEYQGKTWHSCTTLRYRPGIRYDRDVTRTRLQHSQDPSRRSDDLK